MNIRLADDVQETLLFSRGPRRFDTYTAAAWIFWLVILANAAVIIWLWVNGGGVSSVHTVGDLWTSIGRVTGLLSVFLALDSAS